MNWKKNVAVVLGVILFSVVIAHHGWAELQGGPKILKVKGLYLGMNIDDACKQITSLLKKPMRVVVGDEFYVVTPQDSAYDASFEYQVYFKADSDKNVISISLGCHIVNDIFNVKDLSVEDFVQEFISVYQIPKMQVNYDQSNTKFIFTSSAGYELWIGGDKSIVILATTKRSEMKFD